jgi:hypothetical protein
MPSLTSTTVRIVSQSEQSTLSKAQKAYNKLIDKIGKQRKKLADWQATIPLFQQKMESKYGPVSLLYTQCRRELVHALDQAYANKGLSKNDRVLISDFICSVAAEILTEQDDVELKAIYNRHSNFNFDEHTVEEREAIKSMMESTFDIDLGDVRDFSSPDQMFDEVDVLLRKKIMEEAQSQQAEEARPGKRKKSAKELAREARQETEEKAVSQSIREVFRKLASALHPDREQDPAEHKRKTTLMQKVNVAYQNRDLLQLLELQLELEQIDQNAMSAVSEDRLKHYNKVLAEQSAELQQEIDMIAFSFASSAGCLPGEAISPSKVMSLLQSDIRMLEQNIAVLKQNIASCQNTKSLKKLLKAYMSTLDPAYEEGLFS